MREYGKFFDFNSARERSVEVFAEDKHLSSEVVTQFVKSCENTCPLLYELLTNTTRFYERHFNQLIDCIGREKRLIEFETPNRAHMQFEYELDGMEHLDDEIYYLFNTRDRLSWLKICMNDKQVPVAPSKLVKQKLLVVLGDELHWISKLSGISEQRLLDCIYDWSDGKPCFAYYIKNSRSVKISYYDTVEIDTKKKTKWYSYPSPVGEYEVNYLYRPIARNANSWLYVRAPKHFITKVDVENTERMETSKSNDDVVSSFMYRANGEECVYEHKLLIQVPKSMLLWYHIMWGMSIGLVLWGIIAFLYDFSASGWCWCHLTKKWLVDLPKVMLSMITILLATRGWLIHEEYLLETISKWYTYLMIILLVEAIFIGLFS